MGAKRKPTGKERIDRAKAEIADETDATELAQVLSDPLRTQILMTANSRKLSAKEFADEWDIPEYGASTRMRFLHERGFLRIVDEVKRRGATEVYYRATKRALISNSGWARLGELVRAEVSRPIAEELYVRLVQSGEAGTLDRRDESVLWWLETDLDEITFPKGMEMISLLIQRLNELGGETAQNQVEGKGGESFPAVLAAMGFEAAPEKKPFRRSRRSGRKRRKKGKEGGRK